MAVSRSKATSKPAPADPLLTCVVTAYNEGEAARVAIESLLAQSFENFEILIVDDGADTKTREVLHSYDDPRIRHARQANDGLSSARNRGIINAKGEYICFLDADDMRPQWAFQTLADTIKETGADCIFSPGRLVELRKEELSFYDETVFNKVFAEFEAPYCRRETDKEFFHLVDMVGLLEPQSANKCVRRDFIVENNLRFPNGLFYEDWLFQAGLIAHMDSVAFTRQPTFTYFRRYGRPQITSGVGATRFDAISVAHITLDLFSKSKRFSRVALRTAILCSIFRLLFWSETQTSHLMRWQFRESLEYLIAQLDPRYFQPFDSPLISEVIATMPEAASLIEKIKRIRMSIVA